MRTHTRTMGALPQGFGLGVPNGVLFFLSPIRPLILHRCRLFFETKYLSRFPHACTGERFPIIFYAGRFSRPKTAEMGAFEGGNEK